MPWVNKTSQKNNSAVIRKKTQRQQGPERETDWERGFSKPHAESKSKQTVHLDRAKNKKKGFVYLSSMEITQQGVGSKNNIGFRQKRDEENSKKNVYWCSFVLFNKKYFGQEKWRGGGVMEIGKV